MPEEQAGRQLPPLQQQDTELSKVKLLAQVDAQSRLRKSGYHQLHLISCEFHEGLLTLRGRVPTFHLKQVAQTLIGGIDGVGEINNRLEVVSVHHVTAEDRGHA